MLVYWFTSLVFTERLKTEGIAISMDGRGCWRDNVFVERLWRSVKYEDVYLRAYETVSQAREGISRYLSFEGSVTVVKRWGFRAALRARLRPRAAATLLPGLLHLS
jgi:transposase InsO family protein